MVSAALALAGRWHVPQSLVGALALAGLTSLPNAYAAARLARRGHGAAVVSETLNSNTINLLAGLALPALVYGSAAGHASLDLAWLLGMTVLALLLLARPRGLKRASGTALIGLYVLFVVVRVSHP
jgi:Ca2+/Na+ antiporter